MKKTPQDIKQIEERLQKLHKSEALARKDKPESSFAYATKTGFRVGTELLSGIVVGGAVGYFLDDLFQTKPWLLVAFLFFGGGAGFLNVYRFAKSEENKKKE